jgi:ADP-ribose pyrophosphatase
MTGERIIGSERIYDGRVVHLRVDTVALEDGHTFTREVIQHGGAVAMVPLDEYSNVILVRQYRAAADKHLLEIPAGGLEPGEPREECARRELQEEIGYYPEDLIELGSFYVAASYTTEHITIYLTRKMHPSQLVGDTDERIAIERIPFRRALNMALTNEIEDSKTLIGLVWAARYLSTIPESEGGLR